MTIASPTLTPKRRQQLRTDERAVVLEERVRVGLPALERRACRRAETPACTARSSTIRATCRDSSAGRAIVGVSIVSGARRRAASASALIDRLRASSGVQSRVVRRITSAAMSARASRVEDAADALDHRPERDDRRDADRDADEEEQQPPPRGARLAHRHAQDEHHARTGSLASRPAAPSPTCSTTRPSRSDETRVGQRRQLRVVRDEHDRRAARAMHLAQQLHDVPAGRAVEVARSARRPARSADRWRARARSRRAAARRRRAATDSDARAPVRPTSSSSAAARGRDVGAPAISIGTATFSSAVSDGIRWKN